jgi:hypothetical protein
MHQKEESNAQREMLLVHNAQVIKKLTQNMILLLCWCGGVHNLLDQQFRELHI